MNFSILVIFFLRINLGSSFIEEIPNNQNALE